MKKIISKLKGKKVLSFVLAAIMLATTFNMALPVLKLGAEAADVQYDANGNIIIDGVTQTRVVGTDGSYATTYDNYAAAYLNGASSPTNIVIPGLNAKYTDKTTDQDDPGDYVVQGMTYYPKRDWMLVTAYHSDGNASSKIFALDAATGDFVAMFSFLNTDGTDNTDHGGGITVSEHNIYYSCGDKDRKIAYAPLSALENAPLNAHTKIQLVDSIDFVEVGSISYDSKTAYTAYVCYDEGVLWLGNFYDLGAKLAGVTIAAADYNAPSNNTYNSMVFGYKLAGNSSAEEWDHLKGKFQNLANVTTDSGSGSSNGSNLTWNAYQNGDAVSIVGNITAPTAYVGEYTGNFGSFNLTEGVNYTIEFTSTNDKTDMYMFAPNGGHCNVKQSTQTKITQLEDGRYHYSMNFTAGLMPTGADSTWPTTQSTDNTYTGTYTVRFDQDEIQAGETREFAITDIKVAQTNTYENAESVYDEGYAGSPSYALGLDNNLKDVQYATVDNGKLYLSRSYGSGAGNSINFGFGDSSYLTIADIDLSVPGDTPVTISTTGTGSLDKTIMAHNISKYKDYPMMPMSEGLCVIEGNIFITFEGASNKYKNESSGLTSIGNCEKPVDVIWQLDPYELMETTVIEPEESIYYEKVNSLSEIKDGEEYIIVHESQRKDPLTQRNYLYALNADGNFKDYKLSKSSVDSIKGYNGMIGHPIIYYSFEEIDGKEILYLEKPEIDDVEAIRWQLTKTAENRYTFKNAETYFANCNYLFFNEKEISMAPGNADYLKNMAIQEANDGNGGFWISNNTTYFLWCNDGTSDFYNTKINSHYIKNSGVKPICLGVSEAPGTFHCDARNQSGNNIIGREILTGADTYYEDSLFNIYRRVVDEVASTYESRVYTDLDAKLQEDGTYTVTLETYAISPNHYQYKNERPTDYIIVADTSSSMAAKGSTGIATFTGNLSVSSMTVEANTSDDNGQGINGYAFFNPEQDIYFLHSDGRYYKAYLAVNTAEYSSFLGMTTKIRQEFFLYYIAADGLYYCFENQVLNPTGKTPQQFYDWVASTANSTAFSTKTANGNRRDTVLYTGNHYRFDNINATEYTGEHVRLDTLKTAVKDLVGDIAAQNSNNRIALVQYGADANSGFITKSGSLSTNDYANAFWATGTVDQLQTKVDALTTSAQTNNSGLEMDYVNALISNSGYSYKADGERNVAVIFLTDGIPGADSNSATATAADAVIDKALTAKNNGAFIYSVLIGNNEVSGFNKKAYMDGVSSRYAAAKSLTELGGQSVDGVNYSISLATATMNNFVNFGEMTVTEVESNIAVGLDNLDDKSYLREQLNDAFKFPADNADGTKNYSVKVDLVTGTFDEIGRFTFKDSEAEIAENADDAAKIVYNTDVTSKTITVTNYHYAKEYIAKNRQTDGRKLRVTISGLLADETATIQNTSINNPDTTGIYKTEDDMEHNKEFKMLPTSYFNIPEYTYVLDYGLQMLDTDINGTLKAVSAGLTKQDVNNYTRVSENQLVAIQSGDQNLLYHTTPTNMNDSGYVLIQRDDGTYDWFEIKVVPASNVYFEETEFEKTEGTGTVAWSEATGGTSASYRELPKELDVDGYDEAYNNENTYSNGKTLSATVNATNKRSKTATVTFVGDGIDIISACGPTTGIQIINIKKDGKSVKAGIVDTYYSGGDFTQVPVFSWRGAHGTYTVESTAVYLSTAGALSGMQPATYANKSADAELVKNSSTAFDTFAIQQVLDEAGFEDISAEDVELIWHDDNSILNGGTGALPVLKGTSELKMSAGDAAITKGVASGEGGLNNYLDGFRIYNPLGANSDDYTESEKNASYVNVINNLAPVGDGKDNLDGIGFVTGTLGEGETNLNFSNYQSVGPKDEFYLLSNQTVTFNTKVNIGEKVMLGLRAVNGPTTVKITSNKTDKNVEITVNSATEMFYDISKCIGDITADGTEVQVIVQNTDAEGNMLAVNQVKFSGGTKVNTGNGGISAVNDPVFLSLTPAALTEVEISLTEKETVQGEVKNGVIVPDIEEIPEDNTNTDTDNTNPDNENTNDGTDTEGSEEEFDILSLIRMFIKMIETIIKTAFGAGNIA